MDAKPNLTDAETIALFKVHHPFELNDVVKLGIKCDHIKSGCARAAYRIGQNLCLKIEFNPEDQSANEINCIRKIKRDKRYKELRKHVPPLYYANKKSGTILTKYYPDASPYDAQDERHRLTELFSKLVNVVDLHENNFRMDEKGNQVVIDLGWKGYRREKTGWSLQESKTYCDKFRG